VAYRTVNVKPTTYERLKMYQTRGKSMSDVIDELMDLVEPERLYRRELKIHRKRLKEMKEGGVGISLDELDRSLGRR